MKKPIFHGALALALAAALGGCAFPSAIHPQADEAPLMTLAAHGVQIYECRPGSAGPAWTFVAPEAELFDATGHHVGRHGAGPTWEHDDGSAFTGAVRARVDVQGGRAIPWLLLAARAQGTQGAFTPVTSVQRVNTVGGLPPAQGCTAEAAGRRVRVAYRADYVLLSGRR
jgi:hypothetical protein